MIVASDETMGADDIAGRTKRGLLWRFAAKGVTGVIELGVGIVLARLLMPEDFGIMALAYMVMGFVALFQTIGLPQALVQRRVIDEDHTAAAFWTTMLMGFVLAGLVILLAGPAAAFFREEAVRPVMHLMSVTMVLGAAASVPSALLQRRIDFKRLFWPDIVGGAVYGAVGITMAALGYSYWSLAWASVARGATNMAVVTALAMYVPRRSLRGDRLRELLSFGVAVSASELLGWAAKNVDYFLLGRYAGASQLGIYKKAYEWTTYPWKHISGPTHAVLFPAISRIQSDAARVRYAYFHALKGLAMVGFPLLAVLGATAATLVPVMFGDHWAEAVVPTQVLCIAGALRVLLNPTGAVLKARGYVKAEAICAGAYLPLVTIGVWLGLRHGVVGVSWAVTAATAGWFILVGIVALRALPHSLLDYGRAVAGAAVGSALCGIAALFTLRVLQHNGVSGLVSLAVAILAGAVAYALCLLALERDTIEKYVADVSALLRLRRAPRAVPGGS